MVFPRHIPARLALGLLLALMLSNCGGLPYYEQDVYDYNGPKGVYHPVQKGQTLYSIAKAYDVNVHALQRVNGIDDPSELEEGHHLWIPNADRVLYVAPTVGEAAEAAPSAPVTGGKSAPEQKSVAQEKPVAPPKTVATRKTLLWPVRGGVLTSPFGTRDGKNHHGIDIGARRGTPIRAANGGTVKFSGWGPTGYGLMIIIKHPGNLTTVYAHNSRNLVKQGTRVRRGQMIARVGKTGRASGPHLHFEVRNDTHPKNPLLYFRKK